MKFVFKLVFLILVDLLTQLPAYFIASLFVDLKISYLVCFALGAAWCHVGIVFNDIVQENRKRKNKEAENGAEMR